MSTISSSPVVSADGVLTITDGAGSPLSYAVAYDFGDFKVGGLNVAQQDVMDFFARGAFFSARNVKGRHIPFSFTAHLIGILGETGAPTLLDVILRKKDWAAATSTLPTANGDTFHHTLTWSIARTTLGATANDAFALKYCQLDADIAEGDGSTISVSGVAKRFSTDYMTIT